MAKATPKEQAIGQRLKETQEAAAALFEDLAYLRALLDTDYPEKADIRRSSVVLRRILVDGDLSMVAAPRIGRFYLQAPDNKPLYVSSRKEPFPFLFSGGNVPIFGVYLRCGMVERAGNARSLPKEFHPDRLVDLRIGSFCKQNVLSFEGQWVSRSDVIKYIAHIGFGVHSGMRKTDSDHLINRIRYAVTLSVVDDTTTISFNPDVFDKIDLPIKYDPMAIDPVLLELLVTAHMLVNSPDIVRLEAEIAKGL